MVKIKIITFHSVHNYGAVFQAFALSHLLVDLKFDVEIINYTPSYLEEQYKLHFSKHPISFIKNILCIKYFKKFIKDELPLSLGKYKTNQDLIDANFEADIFISGSDQIWNFSATCGFDKSYFLNFVLHGKKISYAASMGHSVFPIENHDEIKCLLSKYDLLLVREKFAQQYLKDELSLDTILTLDPTLLYKNYQSLLNKKRIKDKAFVCYFVRSYNINYVVAKEIKKITGNKVINLTRRRIPYTQNTFNLSPSDWLSWIRYSKYVITNSFHGVVFAVIFRRNFIFLPNEESQYNNRIVDLLIQLKLQERILHNISDLPELIKKDINYNEVNSLLDKLRGDSIRLLLNSLIIN